MTSQHQRSLFCTRLLLYCLKENSSDNNSSRRGSEAPNLIVSFKQCLRALDSKRRRLPRCRCFAERQHWWHTKTLSDVGINLSVCAEPNDRCQTRGCSPKPCFWKATWENTSTAVWTDTGNLCEQVPPQQMWAPCSSQGYGSFRKRSNLWIMAPLKWKKPQKVWYGRKSLTLQLKLQHH